MAGLLTAFAANQQHIDFLRQRQRTGDMTVGRLLLPAARISQADTKGLKPGRHPFADATQADDADALAAQARSQRIDRLRPSTVADKAIGLRDLAQHRQQQTNAELADRRIEQTRGVGHDDAALLRIGHGNAVKADARGGDHTQRRQPFQQSLGQLVVAAGDQALHGRAQPRIGQLGLDTVELAIDLPLQIRGEKSDLDQLLFHDIYFACGVLPTRVAARRKPKSTPLSAWLTSCRKSLR